MQSSVTFNSQAARIDVRVVGDLDSTELGKVSDAALALVERHEVLGILVDLSAMDSAPPASALQRLPDHYVARGVDHRLRIAIVLPPRGDPQGLSRFYKLAAKRQAYQVDAFDSIAAAINWLAVI